MKHLLLIIIPILCSSYTLLFSQLRHDQFQFEHLTIDEGLSQNTITSILQDRQGFLWIGTQDGLNRYDGFSFRVFKHNRKDSRSISNSYIRTLYLDKRGMLWIGTRSGGVNMYDEQTATFTHVQNVPDEANSLSGDLVNAILEDKYGMFWFGTSKGVDEFNPRTKTFTHFTFDSSNVNSLSTNSVRTLFEDRYGNLWIGTLLGLNRFVRESQFFVHYRSFSNGHNPNEKKVFYGEELSTIHEDKEGVLWVGTIAGGFYRYDRDRDSFRTYIGNDKINIQNYGLEDNSVHAIYEDHSGTFWVGNENGLISFDRKKERGILFRNNAANPKSISDNFITTMFEDRSQNLWIGTYTGGLNKLDRKRKQFHSIKGELGKQGELQSNEVLSFCIDSSQTFWVGTWLGGLHKFDTSSQSFMNYTRKSNEKNPPLSSSIIYCMVSDSGNNMWLGTAWGLNHFDTKKNVSEIYLIDDVDFSAIDSFPKTDILSNNIYAILPIEHDELLLGTNNGLYSFRYKTKTWKRWKHDTQKPNSISSNLIFSLFRDAKKRIWIGTNGGGLDLFDKENNSFTNYRYDSLRENSLSGDVVNSILESSNGTLWIATNDGLNEFFPDEQKFVAYTESNGLANNAVHCLLEDAKGNVWMSTNRGISKFNPTTKTFRNYTKEDGLQGNEFNNFAALKSKTGEMYFGGINGYNIFYPDSIHENPFIPPIVITSFQKFNKEVALENDISRTNSITLNYDENVFSFSFASLDFTNPFKNMYAYKLEGFDNDWVMQKDNHTATFTHLDPGEYIFRVKATNNDGIWNETGTAIAITIIPPYWATWWFRAIAIVTLFSIGPIIYFRRITGLKKEHERQQGFSRQLIEYQETERKRIAAELHDGIAQNILVIKNLSYLGKEASKQNTEATESFEEISSLTKNTIDELRKITHNLRPIHLDRLGLTETIRVLAKNIGESSKIVVKIQLETIDKILPKDLEINFFRIVQESLNNIIKHSEATEVTISCALHEQSLHLTIVDNGKGFDVESTQNEKSRFGFGLSGLSERAKILNGELNIHSEIEKGTIVSLSIPIGK
ncbi:MAG: hypothetical protein KGZ58_05120 [Ignavibacteriales bacterium]|nr:hypothetical protein [Ignavibacteriales bacterium]